MRLKNPKEKGTRFERDVVGILKSFGYTAQRSPLSGALEWLKEDIRTNLPMFVECKNRETTQFLEWYKIAKGKSNQVPPLIVWTKNNEDVYCFLRFVDLLTLYTAKDVLPIAKPDKTKKVDPEDTMWQQFSKSYQVRRPKK